MACCDSERGCTGRGWQVQTYCRTSNRSHLVVEIAMRLRNEMLTTAAWIVERLQMGRAANVNVPSFDWRQGRRREQPFTRGGPFTFTGRRDHASGAAQRGPGGRTQGDQHNDRPEYRQRIWCGALAGRT